MVRDSEYSFDKPLKVLWVMSKTTVYKCSFSFGGEAFRFDDSVVHGEDEKSKPQAPQRLLVLSRAHCRNFLVPNNREI